jgi:hypothetical protein
MNGGGVEGLVVSPYKSRFFLQLAAVLKPVAEDRSSSSILVRPLSASPAAPRHFSQQGSRSGSHFEESGGGPEAYSDAARTMLRSSPAYGGTARLLRAPETREQSPAAAGNATYLLQPPLSSTSGGTEPAHGDRKRGRFPFQTEDGPTHAQEGKNF